ncbi:PREDICTED: collagen alpha-1(III) chain-like, partial [Chinchilla lanigera]|uniref:collagen alpha-1(III) chain-like n=1 Tax=Chinchilla lanigera TaxID=34839 RepID=UPI0006975690
RGFAARAPQPRVRAPAAPGAPCPRGPARVPLPALARGGAAPPGPTGLPRRVPGPARPTAAGGALPRPGTEAAAGARSAAALRGAGCHDCGQRDARALGLGSGTPADPRPPAACSLAAAARLALRGGAGGAELVYAAPDPGTRSGPTVAAASRGGARAPATPRRLPGPRWLREARGAVPSGAGWGRRVQGTLSQKLREEVQGRRFAPSARRRRHCWLQATLRFPGPLRGERTAGLQGPGRLK